MENKNKSTTDKSKKEIHGKRYLETNKNLDLEKLYQPKDALELLKKHSFVKFDPTVEAHFKMGLIVEKGTPSLRANVTLPNGTGKEVKVLVFAKEKVNGADILGDETTISKIEKGELRAGRDFQAVVATPDIMVKIAKLGKILGPKGLMPNPKTGTVSNEPEKAIKRIKSGQLEVKAEINAPLIHTIIGKLSFTPEQLLGNLSAVIGAIKIAKPAKTKGEYLQSLTLSSTMGPGLRVDLTQLK